MCQLSRNQDIQLNMSSKKIGLNINLQKNNTIANIQDTRNVVVTDSNLERDDEYL